MDQNRCAPPTNNDLGFGFPSSPGSWPDIDLSGAAGPSSSEVDPGTLNWESDWIDLGGEG